MKSWPAIALGTLVLALAAAVIGQAVSLREARRDVEDLRAKVDRVESRQKETVATSGRAIEEIRGQIASVERKASEERRPAAAPPDKPGALPTSLTEEDVQKIVDEKVEEKLLARGEGRKAGVGGGDRKMPLHDLAKELALDPKVQAKIAEIANGAKKDIFDILKTPRPDGTNAADDLIAVFTKGDQGAAQQFFQRLINETIPGSQTTYVAGVGAVQDRARQLLQSAMGTEAYGRFEHMNVKPENIETGYDPFGDYFKSRNGK